MDLNAMLEKKVSAAIDRILERKLGGLFGGEEVPAVRRGRKVTRRTTSTPVGEPPKATKGRGRPRLAIQCRVAGCKNPHRSKGYCSRHYQYGRQHGWPMPAPEGFTPPQETAQTVAA